MGDNLKSLNRLSRGGTITKKRLELNGVTTPLAVTIPLGDIMVCYSY